MITKRETDWIAFSTLRNRVTNTIRQDKENYHRNIINKNNNPKHAWKAINNILSRKSPKSIINNLKGNDRDVVMLDEVSDSFNKYFAEIGAKVANSVVNSNCTFAEYLNNSASKNTTFSFQSVEPELVYHLLQTVSLSKATGVHKIPGKILKLAAPVIAQSLTHLFKYKLFHNY